MLTRVRRLEHARAPAASPFSEAFGSFDAFRAWAHQEIVGGVLDPTDFPIVVICLERWERDGTWASHGGRAAWQRTGA